jgi:hypothetical protein
VLGSQELLEVVFDACAYHGWPAPDEALLLQRRREALKLAGGSPDPVQQAAALFFAFSRDSERLGLAGRQLARYVLRDQVTHSGVTVRGLRELAKLQSKMGRGEVGFAEIKRWFEEHAEPGG